MAPATRRSRSSAGSAMHFNCPLIYAALAGNTSSNIQATSSTPATARSPPRRRSPSAPSSGGLGKAAMAAQSHVGINSLPDGPLSEIFIGLDRLPSAAIVSSRWRRIISNDNFLKDFCERHPSSPLLGIFTSDPQLWGMPVFHKLNDDVPDLNAVVSYADTALAYLEMGDWYIKDCRNGRLLLSNMKNELCIYDPLSRLCVPIPKRDDTDGTFVSVCLLDTSSHQVVSVQRLGKSAEADVSFRVVSVQQRGWRLNKRRNIRAVEYDPSMPKWRDHPWQSVSAMEIHQQQMPQWGGAMYAAGHIFWEYGAGSLVMLDITTMRFATLFLPATLSASSYAMGEIEDGMGCLVCLQVPKADFEIHTSLSSLEPRLQVWLLEKGEADNICFKIKEEVYVSKFLGANASVWTVDSVINGLALLSRQERDDHYVVDLQSMTRKAVVKFRGNGYLYQMPWPPAGLAATSTFSILDNTPDVNEGSGDEVEPCENHHSLKSPVNTTKTVEVENSKTHMNSAQHDPIENASLDLDGDSAGIQPVEMDPSNELTLQTAAVLPFVSCNGAIQEEKSEIDNLPENTTEGAEMFEPQNCDMAHPQVSCANKISETKVVADSHYSDLPLLQKKSELAMFNHFGWVYPYQMLWPPAIICGSTPPMEDNGIDLDDGSARIQPEETAHQSEAHDPNNEEPYGQRKKQKTDATRAVVSLNNCKTTLGHLDHHIPSPSRKSTDGDEHSKPSSSNRMKDAPTLSILDNTPDINEGSGDEAAPCENHHSIKSPAPDVNEGSGDEAAPCENQQSTGNQQMIGCSAYKRHQTDEEAGRQRKKLKTNVTSNACPEELVQHMPSPSSCNVLVVERETISCRNSSMGQLPTTHDTPPNKGSSNCPQQGDPPRKSRRKEAAHPKGTRRTRSSHAVHDISSVEAVTTSTPAEAAHPKGTRRTRSSHAVHDISSVEAVTTSTPAVSQTNLRGTCRNSSMGRPATQEKPLRKGKGLLHTCSYNGCGKKFRSIVELEGHVKSKYTQSMEPFKCRLIGCTEVFPVKHAMEVHVKSSVHYEVSTKEYKCPFGGCRSKFRRTDVLDRHFTEIHEQGKHIKCTSCDQMFTREEYRDRHVESMHKSRGTPLMCRFEGCTEKFSNKHAKKVHEKSRKHFDGEEIPCTSCGKKFSDIPNFNSHVKKMHTSRETPLPCLFKGCTKEFRVKHERKNHEKSVHFELDGRIKCHFKGCTSTFLSKDNHNKHYKEFHSKTSPSRGVPRRPRKEKT